MDLHSLMLAAAADAASGTLALDRAAPRAISLPQLPMTIQLSVAGVIVGDWSELEGGVRIAVDFVLAGPSGPTGDPVARLVVNTPVQNHPDEPLVVPFAFTPTFTISEQGRYALQGMVDGKVIKTVPVAILPPPGAEADAQVEAQPAAEAEPGVESGA